MAPPKRQGRPRKTYSDDAAKDAELHKPHDSWDFTDYVVPYTAIPEAVCPGVGTQRMDFWKDLEFKTLEIAHEICPSTGLPHGQGRIRFRRKYRFTQLKKLLPPDVHFEPSNCTHDDNYLRKHDSVTLVRIDHRHQGRRNIFKEQVTAIEAGATVRDCIMLDGANYQSIRTAELTMKYLEPEREYAPRDVKQVTADQIPTGVYRLANATHWDGYDAHSAIYINQSKLKLSRPVLREILGAAPFRVGHGRQARFDTVYITGLSDEERRAFRLPVPTPYQILLGI